MKRGGGEQIREVIRAREDTALKDLESFGFHLERIREPVQESEQKHDMV